MVNDMTEQGDSQPIIDPRIAPEILWEISLDLVELVQSPQPQPLAERTDRLWPDLWRKRGMSKADMRFNLDVLRILDIAYRRLDLVALIQEKYHCSTITATSLAPREIERYKQEAKQLLGSVSHAVDKEALDRLIHLLDRLAEELYAVDLLDEAEMVGAVRPLTVVHEGRVFKIEGPNDELIEARFALDAIWDGEEARKHGATEENRRLAKKRAPELDRHPKVVKARQEVDIPQGGFKELEAAYQWAKPRLANWSRCDDACRQKLVWWESFTWDAHWERVIGRGYIMLDLPEMNETVGRLVDEYQDLDRVWYRALPFYLIRGRLEPPPRILHRAPTKGGKQREILALWKKHQHDFKVVMSYNCRLTDADWEEIAEQEPAAKLNWIGEHPKARIEHAAYKIAERNETLRDEKEWISEAYLARLRQRKRALGKTYHEKP